MRIATRQPPLALWQANWVAAQLKQHHPELEIEICPRSTRADRHVDKSLAEIGGKGLFIKELEHALYDNEADIAVHSIKDMPVNLPDGLIMPVICQRGDVRDAFISNMPWQDLPAGSRIGTSSLRRQSQLMALRNDWTMLPIRGNVQTRLQKLADGQYDAIILAYAGLERCELTDHVSEIFTVEQVLPAVGQGAIGIECRANDLHTQQLIAPLIHADTQLCVETERQINRQLGGHCHVSIAAHATLNDQILSVRARVGSLDGQTLLAAEASGTTAQATKLANTVATGLLNQGAQAIIDETKL